MAHQDSYRCIQSFPIPSRIGDSKEIKWSERLVACDISTNYPAWIHITERARPQSSVIVLCHKSSWPIATELSKNTAICFKPWKGSNEYFSLEGIGLGLHTLGIRVICGFVLTKSYSLPEVYDANFTTVEFTLEGQASNLCVPHSYPLYI